MVERFLATVSNLFFSEKYQRGEKHRDKERQHTAAKSTVYYFAHRPLGHKALFIDKLQTTVAAITQSYVSTNLHRFANYLQICTGLCEWGECILSMNFTVVFPYGLHRGPLYGDRFLLYK